MKYKKSLIQLSSILIIGGAILCFIAFSIAKFDIEKFRVKSSEHKWYRVITVITD